MKPKYKLVIFDFDDTIGHLTVHWADVKTELLKYAKRKGIPASQDEHVIIIANRISETHDGKETVVKTFRRYEKGCTEKKEWLMFPSMVQMLKDLKKAGCLLAIASGNNTETLYEVLEAEGLEKLFDVIAGMDSTPKSKPDPAILELILEKLHVKRQNAVFVGNSRYDEEAGEAAGIDTMIIRTLWEDDIHSLRKMLLG